MPEDSSVVTFNNVTVSLKVGAASLEYSGSAEFLAQHWTHLVDGISRLGQVRGTIQAALSNSGPQDGEQSDEQSDGAASGSDVAQLGTINSIVARLGDTSGPGLIMGAMAYHCLARGKTTVSRGEILETVKQSTDCNASVRSNFAGNLKKMVRSHRLNEAATGVYSLPSVVSAELRQRLNG